MKANISKCIIALGFLAVAAIIFHDCTLKESSAPDFSVHFSAVASLFSGGANPFLFPGIPSNLPSSYLPLTNELFSPFTLLPTIARLVLCQIANLLALAYCVYLVAKASQQYEAADEFQGGWLALLFPPLLEGVVGGQADILLGLLPLSAGYALTAQKRYFLSGIVFGCLVLRPEFLMPALITCLALVLLRKINCLLGLALCAALIFALQIAVNANQLILWWTSFLTKMPDPNQIGQVQLNLPAALSFLTRPFMAPLALPMALLSVMVVVVLSSLHLVKLARSQSGQRQLIPLSLVLGSYLTPFVVPTVQFLDLTVLIMPIWIIYSIDWPDHSAWRLKQAARALFITPLIFALLSMSGFGAAKVGLLSAIAMLILLFYFKRLLEAMRLMAEEPTPP